MAQAPASGEAPPLHIELPLTYSLDKLNAQLVNAGFQLDCSELDLGAGSLQPADQSQGGGALADIATDAAAAAKHASAALTALLASNPAHSACAMLASAAQAAAAAALALVEGEDFDPELDDAGGDEADPDASCCTACHELGDGTRCANAGCPDGAQLATQLAASWGALRCTAGGAEMLCAWVQERGSGERERGRCLRCGRRGRGSCSGGGAGREKGGAASACACDDLGPLAAAAALPGQARVPLHPGHMRRCADWATRMRGTQAPSG